MKRISARFAALKRRDRAALITFVTAGDPDYATSLAILKALPKAGADVIEIGMPFSDPMAEGPPIQASSLRALKGGQTMAKTFALLRAFREEDDETPVILMGYLNPILSQGVDSFLTQAQTAGADGLIIVDCPPEEDSPLRASGLDMIRLATPTTDASRLPRVLDGASGFLYYVSILGVTGAATPDLAKTAAAVAQLKRHTILPIAVGFGVKTAAQAQAIAHFADGVVVGSAIVETIRHSLDAEGCATFETVAGTKLLVESLSQGVRRARAEPRTEEHTS